MLRALRIFLDVAKHRSVSRAATANGVTQSAVSQRIRQLETDLGVSLLDRSIRPVGLTPAGEMFAREGRTLVDGYQELCKRIGQLSEPLEGEVRVDAIYSAGIDLMQLLRENFEEHNPGVRVHLDYKRPEEVDEAVRHGSCDFGIVSYPKRWQGLSMKLLRDERMTVVCPPSHELCARSVVQASELGTYQLIGFGSDLPVGRHLRRYLRSCGVEPNLTYEPDNIDTLKSMLAIGEQIAILPRRTVLREVAAGTLAIVELEPELNRPIGIIYTGRQSLRAPARSFFDFLLEHADPDAALPAEEPSVEGPMQVPLASSAP